MEALLSNNKGPEGRRIQQQHLSMDMIGLILAMLPAKTLVKFRCVCKSWNNLVSGDAYFAALHWKNREKKKKSSASITLCYSYHHDHEYAYDVQEYALFYRPCEQGSKLHTIEFCNVIPDEYGSFDRCYRMTNSCNGLVGMYTDDAFCVANPSIMKLTALPRGSPHVARHKPLAGIGFDPSTAVYKAVRLFTRKYDQQRRRRRSNSRPPVMRCEVFSLGGSSWKSVEEDRPPLVLPPYMEEQGGGLCSVVDGGALLYWTIEFRVKLLRRPEIAFSFDVKEEKFGVLLHPEGSSRPEESCVRAIGGHLRIVDTLTRLQQIEIWALKDQHCRGSSSSSTGWVKQYRVDLSRTWLRVGTQSGAGLLMTDGRRILLYTYSGANVYYDIITLKIVKREGIDYGELANVAPYTESIVWPFST